MKIHNYGNDYKRQLELKNKETKNVETGIDARVEKPVSTPEKEEEKEVKETKKKGRKQAEGKTAEG